VSTLAFLLLRPLGLGAHGLTIDLLHWQTNTEDLGGMPSFLGFSCPPSRVHPIVCRTPFLAEMWLFFGQPRRERYDVDFPSQILNETSDSDVAIRS
jgi:hypothetical protein